MRRLACRCGRAVFFDNHSCGNCGRRLAFDAAQLAMRSEQQPGSGLAFCSNRDSASRCNWLAPETGASCLSCSTSETIPALSKPENLGRWRKLEEAKRRLLYDLLRLGPSTDASQLRFVFKEDRRTNPDVHEEHVQIGHSEGVITINAAEADEVYRESMRLQMNEPYRTLLGHFRHESGHYFFDRIVAGDDLARARALFGDESTGYDEALRRYYRDGPVAGWEERFISAYASAHPAEDWAECWAHYLHIGAVLEAAQTSGLVAEISGEDWQERFVDLVIAINEVMRSMGLPDAYPFVITSTIAEKIQFIHDIVRRFTSRPGGPSPAAD